MENGTDAMFAKMMASMAQAASGDAPFGGEEPVFGANASSKVEFFERANSVDESVEGIASRMMFTGAFAIDEFMIQHKDGSPVDAGFGADFDDANGPVAAWVWFSRPVNDAVKAKFEEFFEATFDETNQRMDIAPDAFLAFSDSRAWGIYEQEEEDPLW